MALTSAFCTYHSCYIFLLSFSIFGAHDAYQVAYLYLKEVSTTYIVYQIVGVRIIEVSMDGEYYGSDGNVNDMKNAWIVEVGSVIYSNESSSIMEDDSMQSVLNINSSKYDFSRMKNL